MITSDTLTISADMITPREQSNNVWMFNNFNDWMTYVYSSALESSYCKKMFNWNIDVE